LIKYLKISAEQKSASAQTTEQQRVREVRRTSALVRSSGKVRRPQKVRSILVVLKWDGGKWRGAGYNAGPKATPDDGSTPQPPPSSTTETHTEEHVKPQPQ